MVGTAPMTQPRKMLTHERPKWFIFFTVEGQGEFPFDMLRYDSCIPTYEEEARHLGGIKRRRVTLVSHRENQHWLPTEGRWQSFGWRVLDIVEASQ